uniref:Ovule protein n=1 Tax=Romanomermis culicivorax TaxID=13658 RepID=A0A915IKU6_ROMCU
MAVKQQCYILFELLCISNSGIQNTFLDDTYSSSFILTIHRAILTNQIIITQCEASLSLKLFKPKIILECLSQVQVVLVRFWSKLMDFSPPS